MTSNFSIRFMIFMTLFSLFLYLFSHYLLNENLKPIIEDFLIAYLLIDWARKRELKENK